VADGVIKIGGGDSGRWGDERVRVGRVNAVEANQAHVSLAGCSMTILSRHTHTRREGRLATITVWACVSGQFICTQDHDQRQRSLRGLAFTGRDYTVGLTAAKPFSLPADYLRAVGQPNGGLGCMQIVLFCALARLGR
jgi:hypothetical protein